MAFAYRYQQYIHYIYIIIYITYPGSMCFFVVPALSRETSTSRVKTPPLSHRTASLPARIFAYATMSKTPRRKTQRVIEPSTRRSGPCPCSGLAHELLRSDSVRNTNVDGARRPGTGRRGFSRIVQGCRLPISSTVSEKVGRRSTNWCTHAEQHPCQTIQSSRYMFHE